MLLLLERADFSTAEEEAERAVELYPLHDRRFPFFVSDFALVQVMQHRYSAAVPLLQLCMDVIEQPSARAVVASMLARSYAALGGAKDEYERLRQLALTLAQKHPEHSAAAYYHLAEAARACRSWKDAEQHARRALELAKSRGDREIARHAERVQSLIQEHRVTPPLRTTGPEQLTGELRVRLKRWNPQNHRGRVARIPFRNQWVA
jgi:tetratricopeptide (TPR) repeat protein